MIDWTYLLDNISERETVEDIIKDRFVKPLIHALGFEENEYLPEFPTGVGAQKVDFALRKNIEDDFFATRQNPYLLVEAKARATRKESSPPSITLLAKTSAKAQITQYLRSPNCQTAQWGMITNATHIQLLRKHGRVVYPATNMHLIKTSNIEFIIDHLKGKINNTQKALTVCVYNNKGGVGKTTTLINIAALLSFHKKKKVLLIDFDSQGDLTTSLRKYCTQPPSTLYDCLINTNADIKQSIIKYSLPTKGEQTHIFDIIPCDKRMEEFSESSNVARIENKSARLKDLLSTLINDYDYIFIDCPTQWSFFSQSGVYASDVVLIPTRHSDLNSLHNAARVITNFIPEINRHRREKSEYDGGTIPLPIFFNGEDPTDAQLEITNREISNIIENVKKSHKIDLTSYFWPKAKIGNVDKKICTIPKYAAISKAAFNSIPAVCNNRTAAEHYNLLVKEYFL